MCMPYLGSTDVKKRKIDETRLRALLNEDISSESEHKYNVMDQDAAWKMRVQVSRTIRNALADFSMNDQSEILERDPKCHKYRQLHCCKDFLT